MPSEYSFLTEPSMTIVTFISLNTSFTKTVLNGFEGEAVNTSHSYLPLFYLTIIR
jgi:hypothetical protein